MEREKLESIAQKLLFICLRVVKNSHIFFALFCRVYFREKFRYSPEKQNLSEWNFIRFNDLSLWPIVDTMMMMMTTLNLKLTLFFSCVCCSMFSTYNKWESISSRRALIISCLGARTRNYTRSNQAWSWENWLRFKYTFFRVSIASLKRAFRCFQGCTECMVLRVEWWEKMGIYMWKLHVLLFFDDRLIRARGNRRISNTTAALLWVSSMSPMIKSQWNVYHEIATFFHSSSSFDWNFRLLSLLWMSWIALATMWRRLTGYYNIHVSSGRRKA